MPSDLKDSLSFQDTSSLTQSPSSKYPNIQTSEPLWKRAPTRDVSGKPYADFMMLIPGLRKFESCRLQNIIKNIEAILMKYEKDIILADLNLKINVLWVTVTPNLGLTAEIAALLHHAIPEAKLVSQNSAT